MAKLRGLAKADLADSEQFACLLADVPRLHVRLDALLFKMRLEEILGELKPELAAVTEALKKVRRGEKDGELKRGEKDIHVI